MTRLLTACVVSLAAVASAQTPYPNPSLFPNPPWCPTCWIAAAVDVPSPTGNPAIAHARAAKVRQAEFYLAGWAFVCHNGALPNRFDLSYRADDGRVVLVRGVTVINTLYRPDVRQALQRACPGAGDFSGFHLYPPPEAVPLGTRDWYLAIWRDGLRHSRQILITVE